MSPSHISPGLTGQWRAWNRRTTDYHTAPSLVSRCRLMGSWKVKMKKWFSLHASLSLIFPLRHSSASDRCHHFCLGSRFLPLRHGATGKTVQTESEESERVRREAGVRKIKLKTTLTTLTRSSIFEDVVEPLVFIKYGNDLSCSCIAKKWNFYSLHVNLLHWFVSLSSWL